MQITLSKPAPSATGASDNGKSTQIHLSHPPSALPRVEIIDEKPGDVLRVKKVALANFHAALLQIMWKAATIEEATDIARRALEFANRSANTT